MTAVRQTVTLGPADRVTLLRAVISVLAATLIGLSFGTSVHPRLIAGLAGIALVLDCVDGQVARRTGTASDFGARFDMEVDAFLILALSIDVARELGGWVLAVGAARYLLLVATRAWPWLAQPVPQRYWAKVAAAAQGVALTAAASGALPTPVAAVGVATALGLLAESFWHEVVTKRRLVRAAVRRSRSSPVRRHASPPRVSSP